MQKRGPHGGGVPQRGPQSDVCGMSRPHATGAQGKQDTRPARNIIIEMSKARGGGRGTGLRPRGPHGR